MATATESPDDDNDSLTRILRRIADRDETVDDQQVSELFWELRKIADRLMRSSNPAHTLQPTALVNEAYLRMFGGSKAGQWHDRGHFFKVAATAMRTLLVDHARRKKAKKRTRDGHRVDLDLVIARYGSHMGDLLDIEDSLAKLERRDPRIVRIAELGWFGGRSNREIAEILGLSERTIRRELDLARAFVRRCMDGADG